MFWLALTALTEPRTLWLTNRSFQSPRRWVALHTSLLYFAPGRLSHIRTSECDVCYTFRRGCSYAVVGYTMPCNVYAFLQPSAIFQQYSLRFGYVTCRCICFGIIIFYRFEIYCRIFTLSSTMPSVLHILHCSIVGLRCFFFLIQIVAIFALVTVHITGSQVQPTMPSVLYIQNGSIIGLQCLLLLSRSLIIAILALIPVDINCSQVKLLEFSYSPLSPADSGDGVTLIAFITFIFEIPTSPWHPKMQLVIRAIVVYRDVWVSASDSRFLKRHFGGQIVRNKIIVNTRCFHTGDHSRRRVLRLLNLTLDCSKSVCIHPLLVALR